MANNKRIYSRRPKLIDTRYTQLSLFTENGDAVRFLPLQDTRKIFNEYAYAIDANRKQLYRFAYSLAKNKFDAEELVQDTIERALKNKESVKGSLIGWLQNTLKWLFFNSCRDKGKSIVRYTGDAPNDTTYFIEENTAIKDIGLRDAKNMLSFLSDANRQLAEMKFLHKMQYNEIAIDLNMPIGTVKSRLYFIRKILKQQLKDYEK